MEYCHLCFWIVSICSWVTVTVLIVGNSSIRKSPLSIIQFNMIIVLLLHHLVYDVYVVVVMFPFEIFYWNYWYKLKSYLLKFLFLPHPAYFEWSLKISFSLEIVWPLSRRHIRRLTAHGVLLFNLNRLTAPLSLIFTVSQLKLLCWRPIHQL